MSFAETHVLQRFLLVGILLVYALTGALYAIRIPKWQAPDEPAHFNYIRTIGDTGALPILQPGDYDHEYLEEIKAAKFPPSLSIDSIRYESYQPPLYYVAATPMYLLARGSGLDAQVLALRLFSLGLGLLVLLLTYATLAELFSAESLIPLATVGLIATIPMHIAITASISNDTAAELVLAVILLLSVKRLKGAVSDRRYVLLGGIVFGAALLTKTTALLTGAAVLTGAELARAWLQASESHARMAQLRATAPRLVGLYAIALTLALPMLLRNILTYGITDPLGLGRHDSIVVGQPTTIAMINQVGWNRILIDFFAITFRSFWAQFGWMGVLVNDRIYLTLLAFSVAAVFGLLILVARQLQHRGDLSMLQLGGLALFALLFLVSILDYIGYNIKFLQFQGRYLFPAIVPIGTFFILGLRELARLYTHLIFALLYVALVGLDLACLFLYIVPQLKLAS